MAQMANDHTSILGEYENFLYGPPEKNHYHYVTLLHSDKGGYIWRTLCNEWTLTPSKDQKLEFMVGDQCPYYETGYETMKFKTDHKGNIIGAFGPWNEYFTKVERHSSIKYNLKGVQKPKQMNDEKEGCDTAKGDIEKHSSTTFEWKGGNCLKNQCIGRVSIDENFVISFGMVINGKNCNEWESILHIGHENMQRSPGFWLHPKSYQLHVRLSDTQSNNTGYDPNVELEKGVLYQIRLQCVNNEVSLFVNDKLKKFSTDVYHVTGYKCPVFVSDPWYTAANVTITDLKVYSPQSSE
eukprot:580883_1